LPILFTAIISAAEPVRKISSAVHHLVQLMFALR
jgi:hypothetical protein